MTIKVISIRPYESSIPSVKKRNEAEDPWKLTNGIEERCFDKDEKNDLSENEAYHDTQSSSYGTIVKGNVDSVKSNIEIKVISARPYESSILSVRKRNEAKDPWKITNGIEERCFHKDDKNDLSEDKAYPDAQSGS